MDNNSSTVFGKPVPNTAQSIYLNPGESTNFSFSADEIDNLREVDGALEIKFDNGSVLLIENFESLAKAGGLIQLSDFTRMDLSELYGSLSASGAAEFTSTELPVFLAEPAEGITREIRLEEGAGYKLGFDLNEAKSITQEDGHLVIDFKEGGVLVLRAFAAVTEGDLPPEMTLLDGRVINASDLITSTEFAQAPAEEELIAEVQAELREHESAPQVAVEESAPEAVEPAAGEAEPVSGDINLDGMQMSEAALEAAQIEPAAGTAAAGAGASGRGGFGFQSVPEAISLDTPDAVGPIAPTALQYGIPDVQDELFLDNDFVEPLPPSASLTVEDAFIKEDGSQALNIEVNNNGGSAVSMVLTVAGIPATWTLTGGGSYDAATETWTINIPAGQSFVGGPILHPPADSDVDLPDLDIKLVATDANTGLSTTVTDTIDVLVDAVADDPTIDVADASGNEGDALPVDVTAAAGDIDGSEHITGYEITGVPTGFTFNAGTDMGGGVWSFTPAEIAGLQITPPSNYVGGLGLNVTVLTTENPVSDGEIDYTDNDNQATDAVCLSWKPVVNPPEVLVNQGVDDAIVKEDHTVDVPIEAWLDPAGSGHEVLTVTVTGIDAAWGFSAPIGTYDVASGTWTVTLSPNTNLSTVMTFTPPADSDIDLNGLLATATAYEPATATTADATDAFNILVDAVADTPDLYAHGGFGEEGSTIPLTVTTGVTDLDGSESIEVVRISNVPAGATLTAGTEVSPGVWELSVSDLSGLGIKVPNGVTGGYALGVESVATEVPVSDGEVDDTDNTASAHDFICLCIREDDTPDIDPEIRTVDETDLGPVIVNDIITADFGNDTLGAFSTNGGFTSSVPLTSDGQPVFVSHVGNGYIGTADPTGGSAIFTLTLQSDGSYTFELHGVLDHPDVTDHNDSIALEFGVTVTDNEGDPADGTIKINVLDDGLTAHNDVNSFDFTTGATDGNVITGVNGGPGAADDLSNDVDNTVTEVRYGSTVVDVPETGTVTIDGTYGVLEISADGHYDYTLFTGGASPYQYSAHQYNETLGFPPLAEGAAISGATLDNLGIHQDALLTSGASVGTVAFVSEGADYNNTLGMYTVAADGTLQTASVLIENGNAVMAGATSNFTAAGGEEIAFFVVADGYDANAAYAGIDFSNGTLEFVYGYGTAGERPANIADNGADVSLVFTDGATSAETVLQGAVYHTTERGSANNLNVDDSVRIVSGLADPSDSATLRIGFEDLPKLGDHDFEDIVFDVSFGTSVCNADEFIYELSDADGDTSTATLSFECNRPPVDIELTVNQGVDDVVVKEDGSVFVAVETGVANGTGNETVTLLLTGIATGWHFNGTGWAATGNPGEYSITLPVGQLSYNGGFTLLPPADSDVDMSGLNVTASVYDPDTLQTAYDTDGFNITVDAVADVPTIDATGGTAHEGHAIAIDVTAAVTDLDGSEHISGYEITGVPAGFTFNAGTDMGGGVWTFTPAEIAGLEITPTASYVGGLQLPVTVLSTETPVSDGETDTSDNNNQATDCICLCWSPVVNPPSIEVNGGVDDVVVKEDGSVDVDIEARLGANGSGHEVLTVTVTGIDASWGFSAPVGTYDASTGTWTAVMAAGTNLSTVMTFTPPADSDIDLTGLVATAQAYEPSTGTSDYDTDGFNITVDAVADVPTIDATGGTAHEGHAIAIDVTAAVTDLDGSEHISGYEITGVPAGFTFNAGTDMGGGVWTFTPAEIAGLEITPTASYVGGLQLPVTVLSTETPVSDGETDTSDNNNQATDCICLCWSPVVNPPSIEVNGGVDDVVVKEDGSVDVDIEARLGANGSGHEVLTVTVTGIDASWGFSAPVGTYDASTGTWTAVMAAGTNLSTVMTFTPPADSDIDLTGLVATAQAYEPSTGTSDYDTDGFNITVDAVADVPTIDATGGTAHEGHAIAIDVTAAVTDLDGSEHISGYEITGVPAGFTFNAGTDMGGGVWTFTPAEIAGLEITPTASYVGGLQLPVTVLSTETPVSDGETDTSDNNNQATDCICLCWSPVVNPPSIEVNGGVDDVVVKEDGSVDVDIEARLGANGSGHEVLTVTVTGIDASWGFSAPVGTYDASTGTWTAVMAAGTNLSTVMTFTPPADSDIDLTGLVATAQAYEPSTGTSDYDTDGFNITVDAVADVPTIDATGGTAHEGHAIAIDVTAAVTDLDGSEHISGYEITGVPAGFTFNAGTDMGGGVWTFTPAEIAGLEITPTASYVGGLQLPVTVLSTETPVSDGETDTSDNNNQATDCICLCWSPVVNPPSIEVNGGVDDVVVKEDGSVDVDIEARLGANGSGHEVLTVTVTGIDASWGFSAPVGTYDASTGTWTAVMAAGTNLSTVMTFTPPADSDIDLTGLVATAQAYEPSTGTSDYDTDGFNITVDAVADVPTIDATGGTAHEGHAIAIDVTAAVTDLDGSEHISGYEITGVPAGFTFNAGTDMGGGVWTFTPAEIAGLEITPTASYVGGLQLPVTVLSTETPVSDGETDTSDNNNQATDCICLCWSPVVNPPSIEVNGGVDDVVVKEDGSVDVDIEARLGANGSGHEVLTVTVTGIDASWGFSAPVGTYDASTGTWTAVMAAGTNLSTVMTFTPPADSDIDLTGLVATAQAYEPSTGTSDYDTDGFNITVDAVADVPTIDATGGTAHEGHAIAIDVTAAVTDLDGSEHISGYEITGVPAGFTFNAGTDMGGGVWTFTPAEIAGLEITPTASYVGGLQLPVTVLSTETPVSDGETDTSDNNNQATDCICLCWSPVVNPPSIEVNGGVDDVVVKEDGSVDVDIEARLGANGSGHEVLTVTVTGIDASWGFSAPVGTYDASTGTWTAVMAAGTNLSTVMTFTPPADSDIDLTGLVATAQAYEPSTGTSDYDTDGFNITVDAVADVPTIDATGGTAHEGHAIAIDVTAAVTDLDGSEHISGYEITGVPAGFTFNAGTDMGGGVWTFTPAEIAGLEITPTASYVGGLQLPVTVLSTETPVSDGETDTSDNNNQATDCICLCWSPVVNPPSIEVNGGVDDVVVKEDGSVDVDIEARLGANGSGHEVLTVTVTGIDASWGFSAPVGTYDASTGTWTAVMAAGTNLSTVMTFTPPADSDIDLTGLVATAQAYEPSTGTSDYDTDGFNITVDAVADVPTIDATGGTAHEGHAIAIDVTAAVTDLDGSEHISGYEITGVPAGFTFNAGTDMGGGVWTFTPAEIAGLEITPTASYVGGLQLPVTVLSTETPVSDGETDTSDNNNQATDCICLCWSPVVNPPSIEVNGGVDDVVVKEDGSVDVDIEARLGANGSGHEVLTVTVTGIDASWGFSAPVGTYDASTGTWTAVMAAGTNLSTVMTFTPPADSDIDLTGLVATAQAYEPSTGTSDYDTDGFNITVDAVADVPTIDATGGTAHEGHAIAIDVTAAVTDLDGSEHISGYEITGVPAGFTFNAGTDMGGGVWTFTPAEIAGLEITPTASYVGGLQLPVTVLSTETPVSDGETDTSDNNNQATDCICLCWSPVVNPPSIEVNGGVDDVVVKEDGSVDVDIEARLGANGSGHEVLTVTVTGIDASWGFSAPVGTYDASTGTWTAVMAAGTNLSTVMTFTPPADSDIDLTGLVATAQAYEPSTGTSDYDTDGFNITVDAVADVPTIDATGGTAHEGHAIAIDVTAAVTDLDGSEHISGYEITGVPAGFTFNAGTDMGGGVWTFTPAEIAGLEITPTASYVGGLQLPVTVLSTETPVSDGETDTSDNNNQATDCICLCWSPVVNPPSIEVNGGVDDVVVKEDGSVDVDIEARLGANGSGHEVLTVTVTGIDASWGFSAPVGTYDASTGTWTAVMAAGTNLSTVMTFTPPADSDIDLTGLVATAQAYEPSTGTSDYDTDGFNITVDAVADVPTIDATGGTAHEGHAIAIDVTAAVTDLDGSEHISGYEITGVPAGFTFNAGTDMGGGVWTFTPAEIAGLEITPTASYVGGLQLPVTVLSTETPVSDGETDTSDNNNQATDCICLCWSPVVNPPSIEVNGGVDDVVVKEDGSVDVDIEARLGANGSGHEVLTVTVTGIDASWGFSAPVGTYDASTGTWTAVMAAGTNLSTVMTFTPPADSDIDLTGLVATAQAYEPSTGTSDYDTDGFNITVDAVADVPTIDATGGTAHEGHAIAIDVTAAVTDLDGSEHISGYEITGVPAGFTFNAGTDMGGGVWTFTPAEIAGLEITPTASYVGGLQLPVTVLSTETPVSDGETDTSDNNNQATDCICLCWSPVAMTPDVDVSDAYVKEDGITTVDIDAWLNSGSHGNEVLTVTVEGIDASWGFSSPLGTYNANTGTWTITLAPGTNLSTVMTFMPPTDSDIDLSGLVATATAYQPETGTSAYDTDTFSVIVDAVVDAPVLDFDSYVRETVCQTEYIDLHIDTAVTDLDGSEAITKVVIEIPTDIASLGAELNHGTEVSAGVWELTETDLTGLTIKVNEDMAGGHSIKVTTYAEEVHLGGTEYDYSDNHTSVSDSFCLIIDADSNTNTNTNVNINENVNVNTVDVDVDVSSFSSSVHDGDVFDLLASTSLSQESESGSQSTVFEFSELFETNDSVGDAINDFVSGTTQETAVVPAPANDHSGTVVATSAESIINDVFNTLGMTALEVNKAVLI